MAANVFVSAKWGHTYCLKKRFFAEGFLLVEHPVFGYLRVQLLTPPLVRLSFNETEAHPLLREAPV